MKVINLLLASALTFTGAAQAAPPLAAKTIALVVQAKAAPEAVASDAALQAHLQTLGYAVSMVEHSAPASAAAGAGLIVISASVSAHTVEGAYRNTAIPIVVFESYDLPHLGMSGKREDGDFGTKEKERYIWMVNAPHPLSAGVGPGLLNVYVKGASMNWGRPGLGAIIISTLPGEPTKGTEFAYEAGATMDYENIAPARRVFLFVDNTTFPNLNAAGLKLLDAAVAWAGSGQ